MLPPQFDAVTSFGGLMGDTDSWTHTCSGDDRVLLLCIANDTATPPTATYNGVAVPQLVTVMNGLLGQSLSLYRLVNPDSGAHTIQLSGTTGTFYASAVSWKGIDQSTPNRTPVSGTADETLALDIVNTNAQEGDIIVDAVDAYTGALTPAQDQIAIQNNYLNGVLSHGVSAKVVQSGNKTTSWTIANAGYWAYLSMALVPSAGGGPATERHQTRRMIQRWGFF